MTRHDKPPTSPPDAPVNDPTVVVDEDFIAQLRNTQGDETVVVSDEIVQQTRQAGPPDPRGDEDATIVASDDLIASIRDQASPAPTPSRPPPRSIPEPAEPQIGRSHARGHADQIDDLRRQFNPSLGQHTVVPRGFWIAIGFIAGMAALVLLAVWLVG